ncbi:hypothetical protein U1Q18_002901 [Sarracenia purpurea var. burkii]
MAAALSGADYLRVGSLNGFGNFRSVSSPAQFQNATVRSLSSTGMLGRLNTPVGLGIHGISSSGIVQLGQAENLTNPINNQSKFSHLIMSGNQNGNILQGMPTSFEFDQLQHKGFDRIGDLSTAINDSVVFPISSGFSDGSIIGSSSSNSLLGVPYNPIIERNEVCGNQSRVNMASSNTEFASHFADFSTSIDGWSSAVQSSEIQPNSFISSDCFKQDTPSYFRNNKSSMAMDAGRKNSNHNSSITSSVPAGFPVLRTDLQCQAAPSLCSNTKQNYIPKQGWDENKSNPSHSPNLLCSSMNSMVPPHGVLGRFSRWLDSKNTACDRSNDFNMTAQPILLDPLTMQRNEVEQSAVGTTVELTQGSIMDQRKPQGGYPFDDVGSLEDLVSEMMKQEEDMLIIREGDFGYDTYSLGTCI